MPAWTAAFQNITHSHITHLIVSRVRTAVHVAWQAFAGNSRMWPSRQVDMRGGLDSLPGKGRVSRVRWGARIGNDGAISSAFLGVAQRSCPCVAVSSMLTRVFKSQASPSPRAVLPTTPRKSSSIGQVHTSISVVTSHHRTTYPAPPPDRRRLLECVCVACSYLGPCLWASVGWGRELGVAGGGGPCHRPGQLSRSAILVGRWLFG